MRLRVARAGLACGLGLQLAACSLGLVGGQGGVAPRETHEGVERARFVGRLLREAESRQRTGDLEAARRLAERGVEEARVVAQPPLQAAADEVLGHVLLSLGEYPGAQEQLEQAIAEAAGAGEPAIEAAARTNLGNLHRLTGKLEPALAEYAAAASLAQRAGDPVLAARAEASGLRARARLGGIGSGASLDSAAGLRAVRSAVGRIREIEAPTVRGALALHASQSLLAALESGAASGPLESAARELLDIGLRDAEDAHDELLAAELLGERGRLARIEGRFGDALRLTDEALLRSQRAGSEAHRVRWHAQAAELLREAGDSEAALVQLGEAVRLLEVHRHALEQPSPEEAGLGRRGDAMRSIYLGYVDLLLQRARLQDDDRARAADLSKARDTLEAFKAAELRDYFADECVDRYRRRIERVEDVGEGTAVLYPIVLPDRLELLISDAHGIRQRSVDVPQQALREIVQQFRALLVQRTTRRYLAPARTLYEWLIRPVEDLLDGGSVETLVFVPDGVLRTIPVAALHDGERFLIERYAVATTPGIELTDPRPIGSRRLEVLLGGLSVAREGFGALPHVAEELARVREIVGGELLLDEAFRSRAVAERLAEKDYDLVHLATHARFDERSSSGFLVTFDGRLGLDALAESLSARRFGDEPLELLVLSACETARGDERAALGLSGIAIKAGARSAIGSLWKVSDEATAELLVGFYEALREPGTSRAEALRRSQLALLERGAYRHPAYWSAFLLLNSWL